MDEFDLRIEDLNAKKGELFLGGPGWGGRGSSEACLFHIMVTWFMWESFVELWGQDVAEIRISQGCTS